MLGAESTSPAKTAAAQQSEAALTASIFIRSLQTTAPCTGGPVQPALSRLIGAI